MNPRVKTLIEKYGYSERQAFRIAKAEGCIRPDQKKAAPPMEHYEYSKGEWV